VPLKQRSLRLVNGCKAEFRYYEKRKCGPLDVLTCWDEKILTEDLSDPVNVKKLNDIGFVLKVLERP
jgi:hypothetical protein